jgi:hypothetical protein
LDRLRRQGHDDFGNPFVVRIDEEGGSPLRCCLREIQPGERIALIAYQPSHIGGPYAEVGPVFVHAERCDGWSGDGCPEGLRHRQLLLRAYDSEGNQVDNVIAEPGEHEAAIANLFSRSKIAFIHARNVMPGCFNFAIHRDAESRL